MPVTRDPQTNTIGYTIDTAIVDAWRFVDAYESKASSQESRVAYHAILNYFRELGVHSDDIAKIRSLLVDADWAEFERGWSKGWDSGYEAGKEASAPPF